MRYLSALLLFAMAHVTARVTYSRTRLRGSYTWFASDGAQKTVEGIGQYSDTHKQESKRGMYHICLDYWEKVIGKGSKSKKQIGVYDTITKAIGDMARIREGLESRSSGLKIFLCVCG